MRNSALTRMLLSLLLWTAPLVAHAAGSVLIVGGAGDAVKVKVKDRDKPDEYYRTSPGNEHLIVTAEGPVTLSVRFRAASLGKSTGTLRILRDDGPFSDNSYELGHDGNAAPDVSAAVEKNAVSVERVLHLRVPDGEHRYEFAAVKGPPLLVRVFRTSKYDPALAPAPEKNTNVDTSVTNTTPTEQEKPAEPISAPKPPPAPPKPEDPFLEKAPASTSAPAASSDSGGFVEVPTDAEALPEKPVIPPDPNLHRGFALSVRTGGIAFLGFTKDGAPTGPLKLAHRVWGVTPIALDLAWDINGYVSLFAEASYLTGTRPQTVAVNKGDTSSSAAVNTAYRIAPALGGVSVFVPLASRVGLRFRLGGGIAYLEARSSPTSASFGLPDPVFQAVWAVAATGGGAVEVRVGPGRFTFEARYLLVHTDYGMQTPWTQDGVNAFPGDLGGLQLLGGYRFEF